MTVLVFEKHLPDLGLITHYSEFGNSWVHKVSPWTKTALLPVIIFDLTTVSNIEFLLTMLLVVVLVYLLANLPLSLLAYWCTLPVFFVLSIAFVLMWTVPGSSLISYGPIQLTSQGVAFLAILVVRTLIGVVYSLTLLMTTKYNYLTHIVSKVLPSPLNQIALLTYRFILLTLDRLKLTVTAMESRGGFTISGLKKGGKFYGSVFALAFIRSFDKAERVAKAMESRAYDGRLISSYRVPGPSRTGYALVLLAALISACFYFWGRL